MFRQGDVLLIPVDKLPEELTRQPLDRGFNMLAYGEVTGHAHMTKDKETELYAVNDNLKEFAATKGVNEPRNVVGGLRVVVDNTQLWHGTPRRDMQEPGDPDHDAINLPAGDYLVVLPREYSDEDEFVRVAD